MSGTNGISAVFEYVDEDLHSQSMAVVDIPVDKIKVDRPKFKPEPGLIDSLSESIREIGILNPVCLVKNDDSSYSLVSGYQRLEAFKKLQRLKIPAHILTFDEILRQKGRGKTLTRLEENLIRKHFLVYDLANHLGQCKELYESLHPETKHGVSSKHLETRSLPAYIDKASEFLGKSRSTAGKYIQIHTNLIKKYPDAGKKLRDSEHPILNSLSDLMSLSRAGAQIPDLVDILIEKQNNTFVSLQEAEKRYKERFLSEENAPSESESDIENDIEAFEAVCVRIRRTIKRLYETSNFKNIISEPKIERNHKEIIIRFELSEL